MIDDLEPMYSYDMLFFKCACTLIMEPQNQCPVLEVNESHSIINCNYMLSVFAICLCLPALFSLLYYLLSSPLPSLYIVLVPFLLFFLFVLRLLKLSKIMVMSHTRYKSWHLHLTFYHVNYFQFT